MSLFSLKNRYIHAMEYYSAFKKKEILPLITQIELEDILLSKISQTQRDKCHMISLICEI
jgi:hypothetical protein